MLYFVGKLVMGGIINNAQLKLNTNLILAAKQGLSHAGPGQSYDWSRESHVTDTKPMGNDQQNETTEM